MTVSGISQSCGHCQNPQHQEREKHEEAEVEENKPPVDTRKFGGNPVLPERDFSKVLAPETSIRYRQSSSAYKETYHTGEITKVCTTENLENLYRGDFLELTRFLEFQLATTSKHQQRSLTTPGRHSKTSKFVF